MVDEKNNGMTKQDIENKISVLQTPDTKLNYLNKLKSRISAAKNQTQNSFYEVLAEKSLQRSSFDRAEFDHAVESEHIDDNAKNAVEAYQKSGNYEKLDELGSRCLDYISSKQVEFHSQKKVSDFLVGIFASTNNIEKLEETANLVKTFYNRESLCSAVDAYIAIGDEKKLKEFADSISEHCTPHSFNSKRDEYGEAAKKAYLALGDKDSLKKIGFSSYSKKGRENQAEIYVLTDDKQNLLDFANKLYDEKFENFGAFEGHIEESIIDMYEKADLRKTNDVQGLKRLAHLYTRIGSPKSMGVYKQIQRLEK
ncbi:MAG: hypothetical protein ACLFTH_04830 [Candidatus Woesearchaeota archaeon]